MSIICFLVNSRYDIQVFPWSTYWNHFLNEKKSKVNLHDVHCIDGSCTQKIKYLNVCCTLTISRWFINNLFLKCRNRKRVFLIYEFDLSLYKIFIFTWRSFLLCFVTISSYCHLIYNFGFFLPIEMLAIWLSDKHPEQSFRWCRNYSTKLEIRLNL